MKFCAFMTVLFISVAASAQQPPQVSAVERNMILVLQQLNAAVQLFDEDLRRQLAVAQARIAELQKLCGDRCMIAVEK